MNSTHEMSEEVRSLEQQLDCATEYCRQFSLEIKKLKERVVELEQQYVKVGSQYRNPLDGGWYDSDGLADNDLESDSVRYLYVRNVAVNKEQK
jgi:predicted nuclease of restriction endonuclease-like (RecB) superfamily